VTFRQAAGARRSKLQHFDDVVASLSLKLTPEEIATLEEPYTPRPVWAGVGGARDEALIFGVVTGPTSAI
jgi:hypothetical protein